MSYVTIFEHEARATDLVPVEDSTDFELYSSRSSGAMQGYGYQFHEQGTYG